VLAEIATKAAASRRTPKRFARQVLFVSDEA
jgi:hypothetical protein